MLGRPDYNWRRYRLRLTISGAAVRTTQPAGPRGAGSVMHSVGWTRMTTAASVAVLALCTLLGGCSIFDVVPQPRAFEREAARISDQLNQPAPVIPGLKEVTPAGNTG